VISISDTIFIGIICATAAAFAQAFAHQVAARHRWKRIPRYVTGISIIALAFAPILFSALPPELAAVLYGLFWLITGASGLATWISYEADKPRSAPSPSRDDLEKWANAIAGEHDDAA
jgi:predicted membrane channel-forming protein YqfA (hemolysin III family)